MRKQGAKSQSKFPSPDSHLTAHNVRLPQVRSRLQKLISNSFLECERRSEGNERNWGESGALSAGPCSQPLIGLDHVTLSPFAD